MASKTSLEGWVVEPPVRTVAHGLLPSLLSSVLRVDFRSHRDHILKFHLRQILGHPVSQISQGTCFAVCLEGRHLSLGTTFSFFDLGQLD